MRLKHTFSLKAAVGLCLGAGIVQQWRHSPPTNVARVWNSDLASYVGWVRTWFLSLLQGFFSKLSGFDFRFPQKPTLPNSNSIGNTQPHKLLALNTTMYKLRYFLLFFSFLLLHVINYQLVHALACTIEVWCTWEVWRAQKKRFLLEQL